MLKNIFRTKSGWLAIALLAASSLTLAEDVYKWVDKEGNVHYSDLPPSAVEAKKLVKKTKDAVTPPSAAAQPGQSKPAATFADKELEFRKRKVEAEDAEKKQQLAKAEAKKKEDHCRSLHGNLRTLQEQGRVYRYNDKGEKTFLEDKERKQELAAVEGEIREHCNN
jgi:Domain of unknown function (DUF4124)